MPEQPEPEPEDLPKDQSHLNEKELDAVNGGLGRTNPTPPNKSGAVHRAGDPCDGGE
jgi:hypothetical protein